MTRGVDPFPAVNPRPFTITVTNVLEVTLDALTLHTSEIESGAAEDTVVGALQDVTAGSSLSLTDNSGNQFKLDGRDIVAGPVPTEDDPTITVRETHPDASLSPRDSVIGITVARRYLRRVNTFWRAAMSWSSTIAFYRLKTAKPLLPISEQKQD